MNELRQRRAPGLYFALLLADPEIGDRLSSFCAHLDPRSFESEEPWPEPYLPWIEDNDEMTSQLLLARFDDESIRAMHDRRE
jgi:hypothetical protein